MKIWRPAKKSEPEFTLYRRINERYQLVLYKGDMCIWDKDGYPKTDAEYPGTRLLTLEDVDYERAQYHSFLRGEFYPLIIGKNHATAYMMYHRANVGIAIFMELGLEALGSKTARGSGLPYIIANEPDDNRVYQYGLERDDALTGLGQPYLFFDGQYWQLRIQGIREIMLNEVMWNDELALRDIAQLVQDSTACHALLALSYPSEATELRSLMTLTSMVDKMHDGNDE